MIIKFAKAQGSIEFLCVLAELLYISLQRQAIQKGVLLIDDNPDDHDIFTAAMEKVAGEVLCDCLSNAKDALRQLTAGQVEPDIARRFQ